MSFVCQQEEETKSKAIILQKIVPFIRVNIGIATLTPCNLELPMRLSLDFLLRFFGISQVIYF